MNWGIPDWRDIQAYGDVAKWDFYRWRWEFYRRRVDLREVFCEVSEAETSEMNFMHHGRPPKGEPGHYVCVGGWCRQMFGYQWRLPDPTVGSHPAELLFVFPDEMPVFDDEIQRDIYSAIERLRNHGVELSKPQLDLMAQLDDGTYILRNRKKTLIAFDLALPIDPQMAIAKRYLQLEQSFKSNKKLQAKRRHPQKWLRYLRTLDAREAGASWSQISHVHTNTAQSEQTARDVWAQAHELCFNF